MTSVESRLKDLGITLPDAAKPVGNYTPWQRSGNLIFTAGQLPMENGKLAFTGLLGEDVSLETGVQAARLCTINILSQLRAACGGDLQRITKIVKVVGFVACTRDFGDHPKIINGASDLLVAVFGEAGIHARSAVGVASLPFRAPVEVEAVAEIRS